MASAGQESTKRSLPQDELPSSDEKAESASKKQKVDAPAPAVPHNQPDSTERDPGTSEESDDESVDLEGESDELVEGKGNEFEDGHSGDPLELVSASMVHTCPF